MQSSENINQILQECLDERIPVIFSADGVDYVFQTNIVELANGQVALANKVPYDMISKVAKSNTFGLQAKMLRLSSNRIGTDGNNIIFHLAEMNRLAETRQSERFPFNIEEQVVCKLVNPYDRKTILIKSVLDMSATGASIRCPRPSKLFVPNVKFDDVRIVIAGEQYRRCAASVIYTRKLMDLSGRLRVQVGLKFES